MEGKVHNAARRASGAGNVAGWLSNLLEYYKQHEVCNHGLLYPTFRTEAEKRLLRNKRARDKRKKAKK